MLNEARAALMEEGVSIIVAACDADRVPSVARAVGAVVDRERDLLTVYVPSRPARQLLENLRGQRKVAVTFARPSDYFSVQAKGDCLAVREATAVDREIIRRRFEAFLESISRLGTDRAIFDRWVSLPAMALEIQVLELYDQTPRPGAGARI